MEVAEDSDGFDSCEEEDNDDVKRSDSVKRTLSKEIKTRKGNPFLDFNLDI